ncbi:hypothetical protein ACP275_03G014200 [Erythranthe tilingii]
MHSPEIGDYIGGESCIDLRTDVADIYPWSGAAASEATHRPRRQLRRFVSDDPPEKEYPPPIPLELRTEISYNQPPQMPWVMTRHHTGDGRLVITEEKLNRHEYFETHRSGGRLVINLVALENDGGDGDDHSWEWPEQEEQCAVGEEEEEELLQMLENVEVDGGGEGGGTAAEEEAHDECYNTYNGIGVNSCGGYEVAAAAATAAF